MEYEKSLRIKDLHSGKRSHSWLENGHFEDVFPIEHGGSSSQLCDRLPEGTDFGQLWVKVTHPSISFF